MSEPAGNPEAPPPLQFETAEGVQARAAACAACATRFLSEYHEWNGHAVCAACRAAAEAGYARDREWSRFAIAAVYGLGAAIGGGVLYWGFVLLTNIEFGLMAIAVGWLVGKAVMKGSNMRGGRRYQFLALALTYLSITLSYGALIFGQLIKTAPPLVAFLLILGAPFLAGFSNIIGLVIIAIGLFEAWKQTRPVPFSAGGPYRLGSGPLEPAAAPSATE